jgi:SNF2 family DNA or RNA helicase
MLAVMRAGGVLFQLRMPRNNDASLVIDRKFLMEIGGWRAMKEAEALVQAGKVESVEWQPPLLSGRVLTGTSSVNARLHIGSRLSDVENTCSCRQAREYGTICCHVVALGLVHLGNHYNAADADEALLDPTPTLIQEPPITYILNTEAADTACQLKLNIIFPTKIVDAWLTGEIRIIVEGSVNHADPVPLDQIVKNAGVEPFAVSDADATALDAIRSYNQDQLPGMWILPAKDAGEFLKLLIGHASLWLGKKQSLHMPPAVQKSRLNVTVNEVGSLNLCLLDDAHSEGQVLQSKTGQWWFHADRLLQLNGLPLKYLGLRGSDREVPREELAHFFNHEMRYLERQVDLQLAPECDEFKFKRQRPQIKLVLDGMLSGLSCQVQAVYPDHTEVIKGGDTMNPLVKGLDHSGAGSGKGRIPRANDWRPDPHNAKRFYITDKRSEDRVRTEILQAGFLPGKRNPDHYTLSPESRVGYFLANILPKWKQKWEIEYTSRMQKVAEQCDLIEPELSIENSGEDWLSMDIQFREESGKSQLSGGEVRQLLEKGVSHQRLNSGRIALLPSKAVKEFHEVLFDCQVQQENGQYRLDKRYAGYLGEALKDNNWKLSEQSNWQPPESLEHVASVQLEEPLLSMTRGYQREGISWIHYLSENRLHGVLADEMGLGKTLQALAYLNYRRQRKILANGNGNGNENSSATEPAAPLKPALVVCPTSLVYNWRDEITKFVPHMKSLVLHGPARKKEFSKIPDHDLVITSYALLRRDLATHKAQEFDIIILDEAQFIKNRASQNAKSVKQLEAKSRLVLTGTPLENSPFDLWSIFDFLMPGYLGTAKEFKTRYEVPIFKSGDTTAQNRLRQRVRPFILRRTKKEVVKELPSKIDQIAYCDLSSEQQAVYKDILAQARKMVFDSSGKDGADQKRMTVLTTLMRLRQACCHLSLLPIHGEKKWKAPSSKLDYFFDLLEQARDGNHRVLVFSQFVRLLKVIGKELEERDITYCYMDGSTIDRKGEVKRFQTDKSVPVFLISLKAGGTGLNLTGADTVVHFDPWWNPAVQEQATARAHRIGQTRVVNSYKLIARGTVEEKIIDLQKKKMQMVANTLISEDAFIQNLSWDELQDLLH